MVKKVVERDAFKEVMREAYKDKIDLSDYDVWVGFTHFLENAFSKFNDADLKSARSAAQRVKSSSDKVKKTP